MRFYFLVLVLLAALTSSAQDKKGIRVGEEVPDISLTYLSNSLTTPFIPGKDNKLLILDFWATWCNPCLASMPKLQHLQEKFAGKVQVLTIVYQPPIVVDPFIRRFHKDFGFNLPVVAGNDDFDRLFPHTFLPHYVWIGPDGRVKGFTDAEGITEENVKSALDNKNLEGPVKIDSGVKAPYDAPAFPLVSTATYYQSVFTGYEPKYHSIASMIPLADTSRFRITMINSSIISLFHWAYGTTGELSPQSRVLVLSKDSVILHAPSNNQLWSQWHQQHSYCYELIGPSSLKSKAYTWMQQDLDRLFPQYKAGLEKRKTKCLALVAFAKTGKLFPASGKPQYAYGPYGIDFRNAGLGGLTNILSLLFLQSIEMPVVNHTGITQPVNIAFEANMTNIESLNQALAPYGLRLEEKELLIDMIVIRDR